LQTLLNFLAGVALLIWGTHLVRAGVVRLLGARLRRALAGSVASRASAFLAGRGVPCRVPSWDGTALLASSFVSEGLVALPAALAIMLGANVGTALMAQVYSLDLSWLWPLAILAGVILALSRRETRAGDAGRIAIGLGLVLLALQLVMATAAPITESNLVMPMLAGLSGDVLLDILVGAMLAIASFSSLAVVLLAAALAGSGGFSLPTAAYVVIGANLGSAVLASLVNARAAAGGRRVAFGNLLSRAAGAVAFIPAIPWVSQAFGGMELDARHAVVHFHVLYNVATAAAFIGFIGPTAGLIERWFPEPRTAPLKVEPRYLDSASLEMPALALANASREVLRIGDVVERMLKGVLEVLRTDDEARANALIGLDDEIDTLYTAVKLYLTRISRERLGAEEAARWAETISLTINLEHVGDVAERILSDLRDKKIAHRLAFSKAGTTEIEELNAMLVDTLHIALSVFINRDADMAKRLLAQKRRFGELERACHDSHLARLAGLSPLSVETSALHLDVISDMRRIQSLLCAGAYPILEHAGQA
jgi:phosphate:Na+ symporter